MMYDASSLHYSPPVHPVPVSIPRPQVSIERLPARRPANEPRESMNCKSCRQRKIKCNRVQPSCDACAIFHYPCIYDAVPKKRGPKTDVPESLLKRVDGLEAQLKEAKSGDPTPVTSPSIGKEDTALEDGTDEPKRKRLAIDSGNSTPSLSPRPFTPTSEDDIVQTDALLDTYFDRIHGKPFYILDQSAVKQRLQLKQLPNFVVQAIGAVTARFTPHPAGVEAAYKLSEEPARDARQAINPDEPSVDALQALLLLVLASMAAGKGSRAYSLMATAIGMAMALELHCEMDSQARPTTAIERETRRRLFWSCYLLDRFVATGSRRPSLIGDKAVSLRLPTWQSNASSVSVEGDFFQPGSNLLCTQGQARAQGPLGGLVDIVRILGLANGYLAAGAKSDPHLPRHSASTHAKIRQELDTWASGTDDMFGALASPDALFRQNDAVVVVLGKLIYHLIHCLIYRPFLPIDLAELVRPDQHQPWLIDAVNTCFLHANAITEIVGLARQATGGTFEWPAFACYCVATAGTVHVHGAHYNKSQAVGNVMLFGAAADFLARDMQHLGELCRGSACVQHQFDTLQGVREAHAELVKRGGGVRHMPTFQMDDFFQRYQNIGSSSRLKTAHLNLADVTESPSGTRESPKSVKKTGRRNLKRKNTAPVPVTSSVATFRGPSLPHRYSFSHFGAPSVAVGPSSGFLASQLPPQTLALHPEHANHLPFVYAHPGLDEHADSALRAAAEAAGFPLSPASANLMPMAAYPPTSGFVTSPTPSNMTLAGDHTLNCHTPSVALEPVFTTLSTQAFGSQGMWHEPEHMVSLGVAGARQSPAISPRSASSHSDQEMGTLLALFGSFTESGMHDPTRPEAWNMC